jgi:hypothetical protein
MGLILAAKRTSPRTPSVLMRPGTKRPYCEALINQACHWTHGWLRRIRCHREALKLGLRRCTPGNPIVGALWRRRLSQVRIERRRDLAGLDPTKPRHPERSSLPARAPDRVVSPHLCRPCPGARRVERRRWVRWASPHASTIGVGANESVEWIQGPDRDPAICSTRFVSSSIVSGFVMTRSAPRARHRS